MTVGDYIKGKVAFEVSEEALNVILFDRGTEADADVSSLTDRQKELIYADLLMYGWSKPSSTGGEKKAHGGFSHTTKSESFNYRDKWYQMAQAIYKKWGDPGYVNLPAIKDASKKWRSK